MTAANTMCLQAHALSVALGPRVVVRDADLQVLQGQWTAVVGPNGAGKSTLLKALAGLLPHAGQVLLQGRPLAVWHDRERARHLGWLAQDEQASGDLRALDVALLGRLPHQAWWWPAGTADHEAALAALEAVGMAAHAQRPLAQLSGGERQRVLMARVLAGAHPVVLMDEPLAHLDLAFHAVWVDLVKRLCRKGASVVTVLHEVGTALSADSLVVMHGGRVLHQGPPGDVATHQALETAFDAQVSVMQAPDGRWIVLPRTHVS